MRKTILLSFGIMVILVIGFFGFALYDLDNEIFHQSPCEASADPLIDKLGTKYDIWSSSSSPMNFCSKCYNYDSSKVNCKIISCDLRIKEPKIDFQEDSMIYILMNQFWSFPQNRNVDSLFLSIENSNKKILARLNKSYLNRKLCTIKYDSLKSISDFQIISRFEGKEYGGGGEIKKYKIAIRKLVILSKVDLFDYQGIADIFYKKELSSCKKGNVATLTIEIITENPKGQFINEKTSEYRYEIIPFNEYYIKKKKSINK